MANTVKKPWKFLVFSKQNPSGVIIRPTAENVIKNPATFLNPTTNAWDFNLRDEFINEQLLTTAEKTAKETYKTLIAKEDDCPWSPVSENTFTFTKSKTASRLSERNLLGADYAVAWDQDNDTYYFLNIYISSNRRGYVVFQGDIDLFTTFGIKFRTTTKNRVLRSHIDRWETLRTNSGVSISLSDWSVFDTPESSLTVDLVKSKSNDITFNDLANYKWAIVNVKLSYFEDVDIDADYLLKLRNNLKEFNPQHYQKLITDAKLTAVAQNPVFDASSITQATSLRGEELPYYTLIYPIPPKNISCYLRSHWRDWNKTTVSQGSSPPTRYYITYIVSRGRGSGSRTEVNEVQKSVYDAFRKGKVAFVKWVGNGLTGYQEGWIEDSRFTSTPQSSPAVYQWTKTDKTGSIEWRIPTWLKENENKLLSINVVDSCPFKIGDVFNLVVNGSYHDFYEKHPTNNRKFIDIKNNYLQSFNEVGGKLSQNGLGIYLANWNIYQDRNQPFGAIFIKNLDHYQPKTFNLEAFKEKVFNISVSDVNLNQNKNKDLEPKLLSPDFYSVSLQHFLGSKLDLNYLRIKKITDNNKQHIQIKGFNYLDPLQETSEFWVEEEDTENFINRKTLTVNSNAKLITSQNPLDQYLRENTNSINIQKEFNNAQVEFTKHENRFNIKRATIEQVSAGIGLLFKGPFGIKTLKLANLDRETLETLNPIREKLAERPNALIDGQLRDVNNHLPTVSTGNNLLPTLELWKKASLYIVFKQPSDEIRNQLFEVFYESGYAWSRLESLNHIFKSRYYFNFVQATDVFNSIEPALPGARFSSRQKQLLGQTFLEGVSLWHYRGKNTWGGFLNYTRENWEWNVLKEAGKL